MGRVEKAPAKNSPAPSAKVTPRDLGTIPETTPPNGEITPLWYWHYDQNAGTHKEAYQRRCLLNDSLCKLPPGSLVARYIGTKENPRCQICRQPVTSNATILPKQISRRDHWKELNQDGHLIGTCHVAGCVQRYQAEIDALAGTASCMALLNRLGESSNSRFTAEQIWPEKKLDYRKSEVWNFLKMLDHVRDTIDAYLYSVEFYTEDNADAWQEWEKNN